MAKICKCPYCVNNQSTCLDEALIIAHDTQYLHLSMVPTTKYDKVQEIINIKWEIINKFHKLYDFSHITKFINVSNLVINIHNINDVYTQEKRNAYDIELFFPQKIALLQKLARVNFIDSWSDTLSITYGINSAFFICEDKMLIILKKNSIVPTIPTIPNNIKFLNVISEKNHDFQNLPHTLEHINISCEDINISTIKQTNLPMNLKTFNIVSYTLVNKKNNNNNRNNFTHTQMINLINKNCKIPHDCKLGIDLVNFCDIHNL